MGRHALRIYCCIVIRFYFAGGIAFIGGAFGMLAGAVNKHDNLAIPYAALAAMYLAQYAIFI